MAQASSKKKKKDLPSEAEVERALGELTEQLQADIFKSLLTRGAALLTICALLALGALAAYKHLPQLLTQLMERFLS